jgi:hypothetical protein
MMQMGGPDIHWGALVAMLGIALIIGFGIAIVICFLLSDALKRLPKEFRKMEPGMVWLLLIPCFNMVWNFFVFPKISESYSAYFAVQGRNDVGDAGGRLGLAYAICVPCGLIPCVGYVASLAALVLLIIYLVKITKLKNQIAGQPPMAPPAVPQV